MILTNFVIP